MAFSGEFNSRTSFPDTFSLFLQGCGHPSKVSSSLAHISEKEMTGDLGEADRKGAGREGYVGDLDHRPVKAIYYLYCIVCPKCSLHPNNYCGTRVIRCYSVVVIL